MWSALRSAMQDDGPRPAVARAPGAAWPGSPAPTAARSSRSWSSPRCPRSSASPPRCSPGRPSTPSSTAADGRGRRHRRAIALVAIADAGVGLLERLESSRLGEGLILDLRRQVFEHVQRMPIAFFTRTHTGALVSRLNNDVIGAQRAFTSALSGVVTNVIALVLTVAVMAASRGRSRCSPSCCCRCSSSPPAGSVPASGTSSVRRRAQRGDDVADDRALLGARGDAGQAVRPAGGGGRRVRRRAEPGRATSACGRRWPRRSSSAR